MKPPRIIQNGLFKTFMDLKVVMYKTNLAAKNGEKRRPFFIFVGPFPLCMSCMISSSSQASKALLGPRSFYCNCTATIISHALGTQSPYVVSTTADETTRTPTASLPSSSSFPFQASPKREEEESANVERL